jgi:NADH-quinone oxidoreductase subunit G
MQPIRPGKAIPEGIFSDGEIFERIAQKMGLSLYVDTAFSAALKPGRRYQLRVNSEQESAAETNATSVKPSDGLKAVFVHRLFDDGVRMRHGPHISKLAERPYVRLHSTEAISRGLREGDVARLSSHGSALDVAIRIDDGVAPNTLLVPLGFTTLPAYELGARLVNGMLVELSSKSGGGNDG